jgi:hypothetical protein
VDSLDHENGKGGGSISIRLNDEINPYFSLGKGLTQGDHLSPLLFNFVADVFTRMLMKAAKKFHFLEFMSSVYPEGVISLQYADDTLLFLNHGCQEASHVKWLMIYYEQISGMKINYNKSNLIPVNLDEDETPIWKKKIVVR